MTTPKKTTPAKSKLVPSKSKAVAVKSKVVAAFEKEMSLSDADLKQLKANKKNLVFDASTDEGFTLLRKERTEMNKILDNIKRAAIDTNSLITTRRKELEGEVAAIFQKNIDVFNTEDKRRKDVKEAAAVKEAERVSALKLRIEKIGIFAEHLEGKLSGELSEIIEAVDMIDISECFAELTQDAMQVKKETLMILNVALVAQLKDEEFEKKQEEQQKKTDDFEAEKLVLSRISTLSMIPIGMLNKPSDKIAKKIEAIGKVEITAETFLTHYDQAVAAKQTVLDQLNLMHTNQLTVEAAAKIQVAAQAVEVENNAVNLEQELPVETEHYQAPDHASDCQGCPDCQGINCSITNQACKEEFLGADMASTQDETIVITAEQGFVNSAYTPSISQLQKGINAIEAQASHTSLPAEFHNWSHDFSIGSDAFLALEILIDEHFYK